MRSAYHVRELDVYRLLQLRRRPIDVGLSHDWPRGIAHHGDAAQLFRAKSFLRREVRAGAIPIEHRTTAEASTWLTTQHSAREVAPFRMGC